MKVMSKKLKELIFGTLLICLPNAWAEPIWHCSRSNMQMADASDNFVLAALIEREVIQVSLRDLHRVYQGHHVTLSGQSLSACVSSTRADTKPAMMSLGISDQSVLEQSRWTGLAMSRLHLVNNTEEMQKCIAKHHPAIGYLPQATETEAIGPCF